MKKILLVTIDFPPLAGGVAGYYFNRVNKIPANEIVVLMNMPAGQPVGDYKFKIYYKRFFIKFIWPHWLPMIWHIYKIAKREKIAVLWVGQILPVGTTVWLLAKILRLPYFITCHGNDLLRTKLYSRKFKLAKKILYAAEYVEANTQFTKKILIKDFKMPAEKIKIVYPQNTLSKEMVDWKRVEKLREKYLPKADQYRNVPRRVSNEIHCVSNHTPTGNSSREKNNSTNWKILLTVARLVESKGVDRVIKALPAVWQDMPNLIYLIVGDGPDKNRLAQIVNSLPQEHRSKVIFTGAVPHSELPNYYALADAFILTPCQNKNGDTESFGIVYLEALEFGLPVIAGDTGGVKEVLRYRDTAHRFSKNKDAVNSVSIDRFILVDSENIEEIAKETKNQILKNLFTKF